MDQRHMEESSSSRPRVYQRGYTRLSEVWAVAVSLVCLSVPGCMSAPTGPPLWVDPCGGTSAPSGPHHDLDLSKPPDQELLRNIIIQAKSALNEAREFSEIYVQSTFNVPLRMHHDAWVHSRYQWLPSREDIPKELEEETPKDFFKFGELEKSLLKSYEYLQRIAVGLEQVHHDKMRNKEKFTKQFGSVMGKLRQVLCEVQTALMELNPKINITDMQRSIMDESLRFMEDRTMRNLRDWFIYRDFMNCLEYLIELCEFFKKEAEEKE